jgi:parallel beta-helix repeat protein
MKILFIGLAGLLTASALAQTRSLRAGDVLTTSTSIEAREYLLAPSGDERSKGAIVIQGDNLTIDFRGATLMGSANTTEPNLRTGVGVEVRGKNVTIKNLKVRGYKVGLLARQSPGLKILDSDFSYNWKQRLLSTTEREDLSDWMSYHENEKDEWLRFGAGIYLRGCDDFEVRGNKAHGGQNGLMITDCNRGLIWNNDFSFLSSLSLGMYRSSNNRIMHNKMDWAVRGYSHGVYNRGQDSAGILIYEQSHRNTFAYNSVTHGGDGFFLWAGQTTMDTGRGGCNDNLLYGNDFSHAPTNGIEATFSRNTFVNNLILECWHGIWGGYSYDSKVIGNVFGLNAEAIAWEHGQNNLVHKNIFHRDNMGINLWSNPTQDPNWGYAKFRDTRSRDWTITENLFSHIVGDSIRVRRTQDVKVEKNRFVETPIPYHLTELVSNFFFANIGPGGLQSADGKPISTGAPDTRPDVRLTQEGAKPLPTTMQASGNVILGLDPETNDYLRRFEVGWQPYSVRDASRREIQRYAPAQLEGGMDPFIRSGQLRGRRYILVDHWGPYDFKSPLLWPRGVVAAASSVSVDATGKQTGPNATTVRRFEILGPAGRWRLVKLAGVDHISSRQGSVPGYVDITLPAGKAGLTEIELEYVGGPTTDYRGIVTPARTPVKFGYKRFFAPIDWTVKFYQWSQQQDPTVPTSPPVESHIRSVFAGAPLKTVKTDRLDYASGGEFLPGLPRDKFATVAEGTFEVPAGDYVLELTTDDGAKLWVDGKEVISNAWKYQGPTLYTADLKLGAGKHTIKIEHFEIGGYAALKVNLRPR